MPMTWPRRENYAAADRTAEEWMRAANGALQRAKLAAEDGRVGDAERFAAHAEYYVRRAEASHRG